MRRSVSLAAVVPGKEHLTIAVNVVEAEKSVDQAALGAAKGKWTAIAAGIAAFLSGAAAEGALYRFAAERRARTFA